MKLVNLPVPPPLDVSTVKVASTFLPPPPTVLTLPEIYALPPFTTSMLVNGTAE